MPKTFSFAPIVEWTGNLGAGTKAYTAYSRSHKIQVGQRAPIEASADPAFRGDENRYNPEELLVSSISGCHMLWYLHLCAEAGIIVTHYIDRPLGKMELQGGIGKMTEVRLRPEIKIVSGDLALAKELHKEAHHKCFIANSVNFPIQIDAEITKRD
jgi:organic hydroperoxide reductase OsmC/OhrA